MVAIILGLFLSLNSLPNSTTAWLPTPPKATWLWDTSLIATSTGRTDIVQFAQQHQLQRIYLQVNRDVSISAYRDFIQAAAGIGVQIHALDGAPDWALPSQRQHITDLVHWVKAYNDSVTESERFQGIQVDIEPYLLPEWEHDQSITANAWLQSLTYFHDEVKKDSSLVTTAALPFWLDNIMLPNSTMNLFEAMMTKVDEAALMSYRNQGQEVIELTAAEMSIAERLGKKIWIGLETNPAPDTPYITFYEKGLEELERQLVFIDGTLNSSPAYAGISIHDYTGWRAMR